MCVTRWKTRFFYVCKQSKFSRKRQIRREKEREIWETGKKCLLTNSPFPWPSYGEQTDLLSSSLFSALCLPWWEQGHILPPTNCSPKKDAAANYESDWCFWSSQVVCLGSCGYYLEIYIYKKVYLKQYFLALMKNPLTEIHLWDSSWCVCEISRISHIFCKCDF